MYSYREDSTNLDSESRKDFLSACTTYEKKEDRRNEEEAKICALITSSFSEEAKMLLRSNKTADDNDSFAMYTIAKAAHTRVTYLILVASSHQITNPIDGTRVFTTFNLTLGYCNKYQPRFKV
jgi:hypothetical protein